MSSLHADFLALASLCSPDWAGGFGTAGLYSGLLLAGATGSLLHCGPMCGGFVMAQVGKRMELAASGPLCERARLGHASLPLYHLGRLTTYALLGLIAGGIGSAFAATPLFRWGVAALLLLAAGMLGLVALRGFGGALFVSSGTGATGTGGLGRAMGQLRRFFDRPLGWRGYGLGVILGFLPCGLVYAALTVAAATGKPLAGALAMATFGLGTVPTLVALGLLGHLAGRRWQSAGRKAAPVLLGLNALLLSALAWKAIL